MYNEELKLKFIAQYSDKLSIKIACNNLFNAFEEKENEWQADLCTKEAEDLQPIIDKMVGTRARGQVNRIVILKKYVQWCIATGVDGAIDGASKLQSGSYETIKTQMVNSPMHLHVYLNSFLYPESAKTIDDAYRCFFWLAFGGCSEEEIFEAKTTDVNFLDMIVRIGDNEYPIYREAIPAFKNCVNLDYFTYFHPNYAKEIIRYRVDGDQLLRGVKAEATSKVMRVTLSRMISAAVRDGKTDIKLSHYRAWLSGIFYRMYQMELAGIEPDFTDVTKEFMAGKTYKLESGRNLIGAKERQKSKEYLEDYNRWKLAFMG